MNENLDERAAKAKAEIDELMNWSIAEEDKVMAQLTSEGAKIGLDSHRERFAYIKTFVRRRHKEIAEKYGLPHNLNQQPTRNGGSIQ